MVRSQRQILTRQDFHVSVRGIQPRASTLIFPLFSIRSCHCSYVICLIPCHTGHKAVSYGKGGLGIFDVHNDSIALLCKRRRDRYQRDCTSVDSEELKKKKKNLNPSSFRDQDSNPGNWFHNPAH